MEPYRESVPHIELSLERHTSRVPPDGHYYVLLRGEVQGRYRSLRQARGHYKQLLAKSGWKPRRNDSAKATWDVAQETVERYLDDLEAYWTESHKHTRRGGKTMYRS